MVFEFDSNGDRPPTHVRIKYDDKYSTNDVANSIANAINDFDGELNIKATVNPDSGILFTNEEMGAFGNRPIIETALDSDFKVEGMSGGAGRDCKKDARCTSGEDCEYGLKCSAGFCLPLE